ncbi:MAG: tetratricopeptide repeat protein, partial [Ktedonobacteraceae bacterium]|nr:tetratricopeptide repeat protein [Ktedonobacteraceae bacterium]
LAAETTIEVYQNMITQGRIEILTRWMNSLSTSTIHQHPRLLLIRARLYTLCGEFIQALPLLEQASTMLLEQAPEHGTGEDNLLQAEVDLARSRVLFRMGKYNQAQTLCVQLLEQLPLDEATLRAEAHNLLGITSNVSGQFTAGIAQFQKALQLWGRNAVNRETAELHSILASSYGIVGNFSLAEHHLSRSIACWNCLHDEWGKVYNLIRMGMIRYRQGLLSRAEALFNEALTISRGPIHFLRGEAYALNSLGEIYQEQELYEKSLKYLEDSISLGHQIKDSFCMNTAISDLAMTYLLMGDSDTAALILSETNPQDAIEDGTGYDKVLCKLTLGTILLYQRSYEEAYTTLTEAATALNSIGLKRELVQGQLRITSCLIAQGKIDEGMRLLAQLTSATIDCYEQAVLLELKRLPDLYSLALERPECLTLRAVLNPDSKEQTQPEIEIVSSPPSSRARASSAKSKAGAIPETAADPPQLKVLALGEPTVYLNGTPITRWRMARAMELCFFLLESNHPMRKEQIISSLWPEFDESIDQTFRSTIFYLRKTLGETFLQYHAGAYKLITDVIWYDVSAFCQHYNQAKKALRTKDDRVARTELLQMVDLYHGDYVQSFYSNWCTFRRDELKQLYLEGRRQLAHIYWRLEQFDESIIHWQHMLSLDNCLEDAHYGLMRCFLKQGKRGLALRQHQRCTTILRDELGVSPGPTIQNLYQRLTET